MAIVSSGLLLHVDAANPSSYPGSGSTWYDLSPSGRNVTLYGAPAFNAGGWLSFNLTGDLGQSGQFSLSGLPTGASPRSVCTWFRPSSYPANNNVPFSYGLDATNDQFLVQFDAGTDPSQHDWKTETYPQKRSAHCTDGWFFAACTYDGSLMQLYVNNTLQNYLTVTLATTLPRGGICSDNYRNRGYGDVARVCLYNRALTSDEVYQNYSVDAARFAGSMGTPVSSVVGGNPPAPVVVPHPALPSPL